MSASSNSKLITFQHFIIFLFFTAIIAFAAGIGFSYLHQQHRKNDAVTHPIEKSFSEIMYEEEMTIRFMNASGTLNPIIREMSVVIDLAKAHSYSCLVTPSNYSPFRTVNLDSEKYNLINVMKTGLSFNLRQDQNGGHPQFGIIDVNRDAINIDDAMKAAVRLTSICTQEYLAVTGPERKSDNQNRASWEKALAPASTQESTLKSSIDSLLDHSQ